VKRLGQLQGLDDTAFDNEFLNLFKIQHPNIVKLIGYCHDTQRKFISHEGKLVTAIEMERVLCFEYVEGGNLQDHLSGIKNSRVFNLACRAIIDLRRKLVYLIYFNHKRYRSTYPNSLDLMCFSLSHCS